MNKVQCSMAALMLMLASLFVDWACATVACPQPGACCLPDGGCAAATAIGGAECETAGGTYQGKWGRKMPHARKNGLS